MGARGRRKLMRGKTQMFFNAGDIALAIGSGRASYKMSRGTFSTHGHIYKKLPLALGNESEGSCTYYSKKTGEEAAVTVKISESGGVTKLAFCVPEGFNRMWITLPAVKDEHIYGCGEQFGVLDLKGKKAVIWVSEHHSVKKFIKKFLREKLFGVNYDYSPNYKTHQTYHAQPSFMSSRRIFVHADADCYCTFDFRPDCTQIYFRGIPRALFIARADDFGTLCGMAAGIIGRQPKLPDWVGDGAIIASQGGSGKALQRLKTLTDAGAKVSGIWCQDWSGQIVTKFGTQVYWNWQADDSLYPDLPELCARLSDKGVRLLGYINTFIKRGTPMYDEALRGGRLVMRTDGTPYLVKSTTFDAGIVDLTNPEAFEWYKKIIRTNMIDAGLSGWMADFGEYLPTDSVVHGGNAEELHNTWPGLWAKLNREAVAESGRDDIFFFSRAANAQTLACTGSMWCGDQHVDWSDADGMASVITATLSMACVGAGIVHSDIGGYTTVLHMRRSAELLVRWAEMNAFTPVFRCHEGNRPEANAQADSGEAIQGFSQASRLFAALAPYRDDCLREYYTRGIPVNRPLFFRFDEPFCYTTHRAFMLGSELLIYPVLRPDVTDLEVTLPHAKWKRLITNEEYSAGDSHVAVPFGRPAAFYDAHGEHSGFFSSLSEEFNK
jgi:alpha-glucosidase